MVIIDTMFSSTCVNSVALRNLSNPLRCACLIAALLAAPLAAWAGDNNAFDLAGPRLEMKVTRNDKPLPISEVANLQAGDRIWIHPDFPDDQSARYLLIVAFLRGATNPPPENWFIKKETWNKQMREEGTVVTVPQGAQQVLLFLAPETGGDFNTLRAAVRGRPGVFVRTSQDLNQASLDRSRLEKYMAEVKEVSSSDPKTLKEHSILLARTLGIHVDLKCFDLAVEEQSACLTRNPDNLVLDDGHSQSMVTALASGPNSDLAGAMSATPIMGGGLYSAYVGAVVDLTRVLGNLHNASYVYIPALALPKGEQMNLRLNNPPSFRKPMSVIVVGLPAAEAAQLPPLRAVNADQVLCLQKQPLVLPVEGAPLVFSSSIAHDFFLHVPTKDGKEIQLPLTADAAKGGFEVDTHALDGAKVDKQVTGTIRGYWGFEPYQGPNFHLRLSRPEQWTLPAAENTALIVGREDTFHLRGETTACVGDVKIQDAQGNEIKTTWRATKPNELEMKVALKDRPAGPVTALVQQFGEPALDQVHLQAYAEAARLDGFSIHAGDPQGVLKGTRLDQVEQFDLGGAHFKPQKLARANEKDELNLSTTALEAATLKPEQSLTAHVVLKDGRTLELSTRVEQPRPRVTLVSKNIQLGETPSTMRLGSQDELPTDGKISFLLRSEVPERFPLTERIEVATADETFTTFLSVTDGSLVLRDSESALATVDPRKVFGPSAYGQLRFRPLQADGTKGDWQPLASLVRVPELKELRCPKKQDSPCELTGANLYLLDSVASDQDFTHTAPVPTDFIASKLSVPRPGESGLYFKLRDDLSATNIVVLPILPVTETKTETSHP